MSEIELSAQIKSKRLSEAMLGVVWSNHYPKFLSNGIEVRVGTFSSTMFFFREHFHKNDPLFTEVGSQIFDGTPEAREVYYKTFGDFFEFYDGEKMVGAFVGNPEDWCTYYQRGVTILESHRKLKIYSLFQEHFISVLNQYPAIRAITAEVAASNFAMAGILNNMGFTITGSNISERRGALTEFTKLLKEENIKMFNRHSIGIKPDPKRMSIKSQVDH